MYIDFSKTGENYFKADVCIIGAGATGFSVALSLLNSGLNVLVLEGGNDKYSKEAADLHRGELTAHSHNGIHDARERIVGGTTTTWGGQALPFLKEDFEKRDHVNMSGWPISLEDLERYYIKSESILGTDNTVPFSYRPWKDWNIKEPLFTPSTIELLVTRWCKIPDFAKQHGYKIEQSSTVHLIRNANVVELIPSKDLCSIKTLRICSLDRKVGTIEANYIIAAGGAMETVRLFLSSQKFGDKGLGNNYDLVGRYFQDHIAAIVGEVVPSSRKKLHKIFDHFYRNGFKYFPRLKLSPSYAMKEKILHASAQLIFTEKNNSALHSAKTILSSIKKKTIPSAKTLTAFINPLAWIDIVAPVISWRIKKRGYASRSGKIMLEIHSEQEPCVESYITLSDKVDALGMRRIKLNWSIPERSIQTIKEMAKLVKSEFEKAGLGKITLIPWTKDGPKLTDAYHQAGGLRMADNETEGVVDSSCKVFGINNLYVASSAVFPTSSFSNPTMTAMALSIRIAETVEQKCKAGSLIKEELFSSAL